MGAGSHNIFIRRAPHWFRMGGIDAMEQQIDEGGTEIGHCHPRVERVYSTRGAHCSRHLGQPALATGA